MRSNNATPQPSPSRRSSRSTRTLLRGGVSVRKLLSRLTPVLAGAVLLSACTTTSTSPGPSSTGAAAGNGSTIPVGYAKVKGGTAYYAEGAGAAPNYIFPFIPSGYDNTDNIGSFQQLMYRPLYFFGQNGKPVLNTTKSLALPPIYKANDTVVVVQLKPGLKWSNGEAVTAPDVMFWMNMLHAEKSNYAPYVKGAFPDNVTNVVANSPTQLTFTLNGSYNPTWFTSNELSQITPMPLAWNKTSPSAPSNSGGCASPAYGSGAAACAAVYTFLSAQSGYSPSNPKAANNALATYGTNPLWQVVDGPWHLTSFSTSGKAVFAPNSQYRGATKPTLSRFVELPFTTDAAEFSVLAAGSQINVGYLPPTNVTTPTPKYTVAGPNNPLLSAHYNLVPQPGWGINYIVQNYKSTGDGGSAGAVFKQLYVRQAMQMLVDQQLYISRIWKGYAEPVYGPVPIYPPNPYASASEQSNPYPYDPSKAIALLRQHGWTVVPHGVDTCASPSKCGPGIAKGTPLNFNLLYESGNASLTEQLDAEKSSWSQAGINLNLSTAPFGVVIGSTRKCKPSAPCTWEMKTAGGWNFGADPTGGVIFSTGGGPNSGSYSNPVNDHNITLTHHSAATNVLATYQNYLAQQLPRIWQPNPFASLTEVSKTLYGVTPLNPFDGVLTPENWFFVKPVK